MLNLSQRQSQQQKLSPQQIQYIKMLQLSTLSLEQRIKSEMEQNPLLEEGPDDELQEIEDSEDSTEAPEGDVMPESEKEKEGDKENDEYDWDEYLNNADDLYGYKAQVDHSAQEDDREMPMPARDTLSDHLDEQIGFLNLSETDDLIAEQIVGSIDEDGYLRRPAISVVDDLAFNHGITISEDDVERILHRIQRLDPVGIAARDLRECLLIQLDVMPEHIGGRDTAIEMLTHAYKAFTMKHFSQLMKKLEVEPSELKEAFDLIQRLDPKPGEGEFSAGENYVTPDFTVRFIDDDFIIMLNGRNAPELRVNRQYRHMLQKLSAEQKNENKKSGVDAETKQFLKQKMESARWFINSVNQRRQTLLKVMHAIVEIQDEFFRFGEGYLKPMILKDVAEIIQMDISTVSRVVNGKYVQSEFGVYELKYFFSEGLATEAGEEVSNKEVKAIIQSMIEREDKRKPLSDQKIATALEGDGFSIARRTVTKYREQLSIPVARLRKEIVLA